MGTVKVWIAMALLSFGGGEATAQQPAQIETRLSADSVLIGERFTVTLVAEHEGGTEVAFPTVGAGPALFGPLEVLGRGSVQSRRLGAARRVDSVTYDVATFALDEARVPAVPLQVVSGRDTVLARAPSRTVAVASVLGPDAKGIHGVAPLLPFPRPLWAWALLALVLAALLAGLAYLLWRRRQAPESRPQPPSSDEGQTPYEAVTAWIRQLESYDLSDPDAVKPFYVELSNALRIYLARELEIAALERTTREVVETLRHRPDVPQKATIRIRAVLQLADLVKFADTRPTPADNEKAIKETRIALDAIEAAPRSKGENRPRAASHSPDREPIDGVASASSA